MMYDNLDVNINWKDVLRHAVYLSDRISLSLSEWATWSLLGPSSSMSRRTKEIVDTIVDPVAMSAHTPTCLGAEIRSTPDFTGAKTDSSWQLAALGPSNGTGDVATQVK